MRHRKVSRRLGRTSSHRQAMLRNMVTSLFAHERIITTEAKAKELRRLADKMVSLAKKGTLHARRQALAVIRDKEVVKRLFSEIRERYVDRNGGYTRIIKYGFRRGDGAPLVVIELVTESLARKRRTRPKSEATVAPKVTEASQASISKGSSEEEKSEVKSQANEEAKEQESLQNEEVEVQAETVSEGAEAEEAEEKVEVQATSESSEKKEP
ncbi:50S ribosomal protein L17 [Thermosulfuriphilus ammonigenes]|uniref:Large ribosomal subunit protein bL17 n=1 Tax=Thermosulfuriphilus ammonigenes TaxID=1936021 RepID=A0A6G7PUL3_9BACT|nr:large subunit ribosomal protein L17 [Thermosulfuriphilus ammonigenes]QIJ71310.1 50S ribosomal protein L17 [Thermosulfuriphilus ammonigenes]